MTINALNASSLPVTANSSTTSNLPVFVVLHQLSSRCTSTYPCGLEFFLPQEDEDDKEQMSNLVLFLGKAFWLLTDSFQGQKGFLF